jgi:hypothetical protein
MVIDDDVRKLAKEIRDGLHELEKSGMKSGHALCLALAKLRIDNEKLLDRIDKLEKERV